MLRSKLNTAFRLAAILVPCTVAAASASCSGGDDDDDAAADEDAGPVQLLDGSSSSGGDIANQTLLGMRNPWTYDNESSWAEDTTPAEVHTQFEGTPVAGTTLLFEYPLEGSLHPNNLPHIAFHWRKQVRESSLFRVNATVGSNSYHFYFECSDPACAETVPQPEWLFLGLEYPGQTVQLTVEERAPDGTLYVSAPRSIIFSPEPVTGALYYWAAAGWRIKRANFGAAQAVDYIVPNSPTNEFRCAACHAVSRDGSTIAFAVSDLDGESTAAIQTAPTTDPASPYVRPTPGATPFTNPDLTHNGSVTTGPIDQLGHNVALNRNGTIAAVNGIDVEDPNNWPPWFELRDARTGASLLKIDLGQAPFPAGSMPILPEFSPDSTKIVATLTNEAGGCAWTYATCRGGLVIFDVDPAGRSIGALQTLTNPPPGEYHYYPTWSPDGQFVAFMSGVGDASRKNDVIDDGVMWLVRANAGEQACPGPNCWRLDRAMHVPPAEQPHTTWPKFAPFAQGENDNLFFLSFTSRMLFGVLPSGGKSQIWMAGIDVNNLGTGDPSYAPLWLPYQEFQDGSLEPYWAETLPCNSTEAGICNGCTVAETCLVDPTLNLCECMAIIPE